MSVRLEWLDIPTTEMPPDSPYPMFGWGDRRAVYPYSLKMDVSPQPLPARHRVVVLENRYVRVTVLPDMGGRVFSLYDKTAGQETFMTPPTLKFQNVASRGAWLAGGIEFNFGRRGHTVFTVNPVSWAVRTDEDGSASVWVGSLVQPIGSRWALRISLKPDRAAMDLDIHTMGPAVIPGLMYWWTNAAVDATRDSRFFYFGLRADAGHSRHGWPVCDGLDFRWYRNRYVEADMFLMEAQRDYLGFYDYSRHHGLAQTADRFRAPGQKYFTWGTHHQGRFWDLMFSDSGQTYCEIQRGRYPTQGFAEPIAPMSCEHWQETWIPIRGTEGFSATESDLVLSVMPEGEDAVCIRLLGVKQRSNLRLEAASGDDVLGTWDVESVGPEEMFTRRVAIEPGRSCDRVRVTDADGKTLMDWTELQFKDEDWFSEGWRHWPKVTGNETTDELFRRGEKMRFGFWPHTHEYCERFQRKVLEKDPGHPGQLRALAEQALHVGRAREAVEHLEKALERAKRDPDLLILLGWARLRLGEADQAVESFATAACYEAARRNAQAGLACAHLRAGRVDKALAAAERLEGESPRDKWGRLMAVTARRQAGQTRQAAEQLKGLLAEDPLWSRLHAEALLLGVETNLADGKRKLGDDSVSAAIDYIELGLWHDARTILEVDESNEPYSPAVRLAHLAYVRHKLGDHQAADAAIAQLRQAPMELAHPWATASVAVLEELAGVYPDEPGVHHMLGNVLGSRRRLDEAGGAWRRALDLGMEHAVTLRNLALLACHREQHEEALDLYRRAWRASGKNRYLFSELDRYLATRGLHAERREIYEQFPAEARDRSIVAMRRVLQLLDSSMYEEALDELLGRTFLRGEYERGLRYNYVEAIMGLTCRHLASGDLDRARQCLLKGMEYPRNINIGRHGTKPNESPLHYLMGMVAEMTGQEDAAREHYHAAVMEMHTEGSPAHAYEMLAWLALGNRGRGMAIAHTIEQMARGEADAPMWLRYYHGESIIKLAHGLAQLAKGRVDQARRMWQKALADEPDARWIRVHLDMPQVVLERMSRCPAWPDE